MLTSNMLEARTGLVKIKDIEADTMEKLLVYSGEISDMPLGDQLVQLFDAADRYAVMDLVCIWYLKFDIF